MKELLFNEKAEALGRVGSDAQRAATVLIVEDDGDLREQFSLALSHAGYAVREAKDGFAAVASIEQHRPDVIVLDVGLPRVRGRGVLDELRSSPDRRQIPIVVVSGSIEHIVDVPPDCVLLLWKKPISPERLVWSVRSCLSKSDPDSSLSPSV